MAEFAYGVLGNSGSRGIYRGKNITSYLKEALSEQDKATGQPKNKLIAQRLIDLALDEKTATRDFLAFVQEIMNRLEGKPVETSVNANMDVSPFADVDTETLMRLRDKLEQMKAEVKPKQVETEQKKLE